MRDHLAVLTCDAPGCPAQISGPASRLTTHAETAGWQVTAPTTASVDEDDAYVDTTDRCPDHPVEVIDLPTAEAELRLPRGMLAQMIDHRRTLP
ncbi:hypothetical protein [Nocardiopsis sp. L17-MgMaSL7]|uniref:hypothetical protein n=1 Tax=Nocardiopsis sp. L17-MgMaSL7 TaxID=1938893 RepID=UPI000D70D655|nr:hypothetical protein [Nocardiopsis sp. L17-MgMaSL7]PWV44609.1 hypothetical protein BDW27_12368 [Nocardiopsis sp. L17-MgMaSL7]